MKPFSLYLAIPTLVLLFALSACRKKNQTAPSPFPLSLFKKWNVHHITYHYNGGVNDTTILPDFALFVQAIDSTHILLNGKARFKGQAGTDPIRFISDDAGIMLADYVYFFTAKDSLSYFSNTQTDADLMYSY